MHEREKIKELFDRYRQGRCTPEEQARLHAWLSQYARNEAEGLDELREQYAAEHTAGRKRWLRWFPYAAAIIAAALVTFWYINEADRPDGSVDTASLLVDDIAPGGNRATLTLADGQEIFLSESQSGIVMGDEHVLYKDGEEELANLDGDEVTLLVMSTPRGGTYQVMLADGTRVWLNAASTLKYPVRFSEAERLVEVQGEAYFSVAKDSKRPFKVVSNGQEIEVLGTEFNISAYNDERETHTTLVEGLVQLTVSATDERMSLEPGEQGLLSESGIRKQQVDLAPYIAWKDGFFHFENTPLSEMMKQMSRWYDIDVIYQDDVPNERFNGTLSRGVTLQTVLELLRISEINYRLQGDQLVIE